MAWNIGAASEPPRRTVLYGRLYGLRALAGLAELVQAPYTRSNWREWRRLGIASRVHFTGIVERDDVAKYVAAFDIALQPAVVAYASPLKLFEYLALGKAIVAPGQPNIREILTHEKNALLFDPARQRCRTDCARHRRDGEGAGADRAPTRCRAARGAGARVAPLCTPG